MRCTQILYPLDNDTSPAVAKSSKELWNSMKNKLNDFKEGKDITFDELLQELDVSERQYILAIRSSLITLRNTNIKQQVRDIGNKFLNSVEISAQEAVYVVLQLPMRKASRSAVFINTSPPAERVELLKPLSEIENLSDDCEEIQSGCPA